MKRAAILGSLVGLVLITAGCGSEWDEQHNNNTPVGPRIKPDNRVIEFPYNYDNIARACVDGDGVYVGFKDHGAFVVANDPACK
jgi:hypothetical protein